jgi:hypothetical protein
MSYVDDLRAELVAAAARQGEQGIPRPARRRPLIALGAGALAAAAVVVVLGISTGSDVAPPRPVAPAGAPKPEGKPLYGGSLEAGVRYRTLEFRPPLSFVATDGDWFVSQAVELTELFIERRERGVKPGSGDDVVRGGVGFGWMPVALYDPTREARHEIPVPEDLAGWLDAHPDISATKARPTRLAGLEGTTFDVHVDMRSLEHQDRSCFVQNRRRCVALGPNVTLPDGLREHVTILETTRGPLLISVESLDAEGLRLLEDPAKELLDTLRVGG